MAYAFTPAAGKTMERELLIAYLNTGTTSSPTWSPLGARVEDSSEEFDWQDETTTDVLGMKRNSMKKPTITQTFDPSKLDSGETALTKVWEMAVKDQDYTSLAAQDMLIVHFYYQDSGASFAERYSACMIRPTSLGGEGGGDLAMPVEVTYGGTRTLGTASRNATTGAVTFTADS
ncbi:MAG: hypothetical protein IKD79_01765 [Oscillospiraceae bacterium]|nr:hypothetical protein [Oscillospiraceae bacterium]